MNLYVGFKKAVNLDSTFFNLYIDRQHKDLKGEI